MRIQSAILDLIASFWPSPVAAQMARIGANIGTAEYERGYAMDQFMQRVRHGIPSVEIPPLWGRRVLEIGCGHGGVTCYLACLGARQVVGIDINAEHMSVGQDLAHRIAADSGRHDALPVSFFKMDAVATAFADASFDVVFADNVYEHFVDPGAAMREMGRILRPGGHLVVPTFSSILSKYGAHLKIGLKLPWLALLFDERTLVEALRLQAERRPELYDAYPGLRGAAERIRDVRRHGDLNDLTYRRFLGLARQHGFAVERFRPHATLAGRVLRKLVSTMDQTMLADVFSTGAAAVLLKSR